jgi:hypothetical protein
MKRYLSLVVFFCFVFLGLAKTKQNTLDVLFKNPPATTKPWTYWYWLNDNISKEGIAKDLMEMKEIGIDEVLIGNVKFRALELGKTKIFSDDWWKCTEYALKKADSLGMKVGLFNSPGWSQSGGPWVKPEHAMRYLATKEFTVKGPKHLEFKFPKDTTPQLVEQKFTSDAYVFDKSKTKFQQLVVQAFPKPTSENTIVNSEIKSINCTPLNSNIVALFDGNKNTKLTIEGDSLSIILELKKSVMVRSMQLYPVDLPMDATCELQYFNEKGSWQSIVNRKIDRTNILLMTGCVPFAPISNGFDGVSSDKYRIIIANKSNAKSPTRLGALSEIELSSAALLSFYSEKQLNKSSTVKQFENSNKSSENESKDLVVDPNKIIDITKNVDGNEVLSWDVPAGEWIIQQTGLLPTGTHNHPTTDEGRGFEVDKMNKEFVQNHFDSYIGELFHRIPAENRKALKHVVIDSYEQGPQNWTEGFEDEFLKIYGYSPLKWLPVLRGRIVESTAQSNRFLWDVRRLVADMISKNFIGTMKNRSNENGLRLWQENYGHYGFPAEFLSYGKETDDIAGEFWINKGSSVSNGNLQELRAATSSGSIYGKKIISAESFTSSESHKNMPRDMKRRLDFAFCQGINHIVLHVYIHQPDDRKPGLNAWYGTDFNRNSTWFNKSKSFMDYIKRASSLLQQGARVTDVAYFIGEDTPVVGGEQSKALPNGFDYDYINADVILNNATVKNGKIMLSSGASYQVLVMPAKTTIRPELLKKIEELVSEGAVILGDRPTLSPSLKSYPQCDVEVSEIASLMWDGLDGKNKSQKAYGNGFVFSGVSIDEMFSKLAIKKDFHSPNDYIFTHRKSEDADLFFISNQLEKSRIDTLGFNVSGMQPELFDLVTGEIRTLPEFKCKDNVTYIPLQFASVGSCVIVFRNKIKSGINKNDKNYYAINKEVELNGAWTVSFNSQYGAPDSTQFTSLTDWTSSKDNSIKYYSGTVVYKNKFDFAGNPKENYSINLGQVESLASVVLNGKALGTLWCYPYSLNISKVLLRGKNTLEVEITNPWWNRLIGDKQVNAKKYTWTAYSNWNAKSELIPAGLLGPVIIMGNKSTIVK